MAKRTTRSPEYRDANLSYPEMETAIRKIDRRITDLGAFDVDSINDRGDPKIKAMEFSLKGLLTEIFGSDTTQFRTYQGIAHIDRAPINYFDPTPIPEVRDGLRKGVAIAIEALNTIKRDFSENLEDAGRSSASKPIRAYEALELHPEIERQVGSLYRDGHCAEAVEKAVKVLNNLVRLRSGEELDGTPLMLKVFGKKDPILKFNALADQSDSDEQQGFMYLYSGAVMGLRNPRAHKIIKDDSERALEFIAFISLLAKMLDDAE